MVDDPEAYVNSLIIQRFSEKKNSQPLCEYLGMNDKQYALWIKDPKYFFSSPLGKKYIEDILS